MGGGPEFSVETCPRDCVSINWWDRDPVYEDPGVYTSLGVRINCVGDLEEQNETYILGDELSGSK